MGLLEICISTVYCCEYCKLTLFLPLSLSLAGHDIQGWNGMFFWTNLFQKLLGIAQKCIWQDLDRWQIDNYFLHFKKRSVLQFVTCFSYVHYLHILVFLFRSKQQRWTSWSTLDLKWIGFLQWCTLNFLFFYIEIHTSNWTGRDVIKTQSCSDCAGSVMMTLPIFISARN